jgi:hypothetical protein
MVDVIKPTIEDEICAYLDHGFSKEEIAKEYDTTVEAIDTLAGRWGLQLYYGGHYEWVQ